jgi:hypothetical protein
MNTTMDSTDARRTRQASASDQAFNMSNKQPSMAASIGRGILAGLAGTVVMTVFQELIEMPLTGRSESFAPANNAEKNLGIHPRTKQGRRRLNWATHFALGGMWGTAYGVAAHAGLRGPQAIAAVYATVYTADVLSNTAQGLYEPSTWSTQDWAIDLTDKFVQAAATGVIFDQFLDPAKQD